MRLSVIREISTINEILGSNTGDRLEEAMQMIREASTQDNPLNAEESAAMNEVMLRLVQRQSELTPDDDKPAITRLSERYPVSEMPNSEQELIKLRTSICDELEDNSLVGDDRHDRLDHLTAVNIALDDMTKEEESFDYMSESTKFGSGTDIRKAREQQLRAEFNEIEGQRLSEQALKQYNDSIRDREARFNAFKQERDSA